MGALGYHQPPVGLSIVANNRMQPLPESNQCLRYRNPRRRVQLTHILHLTPRPRLDALTLSAALPLPNDMPPNVPVHNRLAHARERSALWFHLLSPIER